jgi:antitoxin ParD1/3/4
MEVAITAETQRLIQLTLANGQYNSPDEVVEDAVRALIERNRQKADYASYLKRELAIGAEELARGDFVEFTDETLHELFEQTEQQVDEELARRGSESATAGFIPAEQ